MQVRLKSYGEYSSDNYGAHAMQVDVGAIRLYFSYETVIAYNAPGEGLVIRENDWSTTTGKHLNAISRDKSRRISGEAFEAKLEAMLKKHDLQV